MCCSEGAYGSGAGGRNLGHVLLGCVGREDGERVVVVHYRHAALLEGIECPVVRESGLLCYFELVVIRRREWLPFLLERLWRSLLWLLL